MPKTSGSGRKTAIEWSQVLKIGDYICKCKHCGELISSKIKRIKAHLKKCFVLTLKQKESDRAPNNPNFPSTNRSEDVNIEIETQSEETGMSSCTTIVTTSTPGCSTERMQPSMDEFVIKTIDKQKDTLDEAIAKFFFSANIPFDAAELWTFKDMIEKLRPGYKPPTAKIVGGRLLDKIADEVEIQLKDKLESKSITLTIDGWSNIRNDPIQAICLHTGSETILMDALDSGSEKKTAKKCAALVESAMDKCKEKFGVTVFAVVTDNENKMTKMWELLLEKHPQLIAYGCSAHLLNLVERDVTPKTILKHIVEVQKYFRNVHQAHGWLKEKNGLMPQIPNDTRWNSHPDCVKTFVKNYHKYREIALEHEDDFQQSILRILNNVGIYNEAITLEKQLTAVANALDVLQRDMTTLSTSVDVWIDLLNNDLLQPYRDYFVKRFEQAVKPAHLLANLMDPKLRGRKLSPEQQELAESWIKNLHPDYLPAIMAFQINDPSFYPSSVMDEAVINQFSSAQWWKLVEKRTAKMSKLPEGFCQFFLGLLSAPASSAAIERFFSTFGHIWSKLRNRLGLEKAKRLVQVYKHLRSADSSKNLNIDW